MKRLAFFFSLLLCFLFAIKAFAHPGSGIVVDKFGNIFFTDTGKGIWKIDSQGKLTYVPASRFHWMTIDPAGLFANVQKNFGEYFERVTAQNSIPALIMCSDFPLVINKDGNIYYAYTRHSDPKIIRRAADGKESILITDKVFEFVNGIAAGADGSIYITEGSNANANTIRRITIDGKMSIVATFTGNAGKDLPLETTPSYCRGLSVDSAGTIYAAATGSRSILKISPQGKIETVLETQSPWTPTGVTIFKGEIYILEWHDVPASLLEERTAWLPRVRKIGRDGKITTLAAVLRNK